MAKEMLINVSEGEECRIAILDDGKLDELYMERTSATSHVGNIYKGRVTNVEPSIQAAFVDFGLGRNGFLHISDLMPTYFGRDGSEIVETVGKKMARRDRPPIQRCLRRGDDIIVQIIKEGIGTKGPTLSTYLSIPGRILVMMPGMGKMGVSKKIEDEEERRRLRQILDSLKPPKDVGFIIRTAGVGKSKAEIERDLKYLTRLWEQIVKARDTQPAPVELYTEGDLVTRTVRDVFTADVDRIVVDNKEVARRVRDVIKLSSPRTKNKVEAYDEPIPLFHKYAVEKDIELMYSRHVPLPSGGSLVIDSTEAIVAIDVNSGKFRDHKDAEMTAFKTDMEAAEEIPRQLRLRDLGGVIICDFIDLRYERHRRELEQRLHDNFKKDRAKTKVLRMSQFGIIEITRQRMRPSLKRSIYTDCPHCKGAGLVKTPESMSLDVMRRLTIAAYNARVSRLELGISPDVGMYLLNKKRAALARLEADAGKRIIVRQETVLALDEVKLDLFDARDGLVYLDELGMAPPMLGGGRPGDQFARRHHGAVQHRRGGGRGEGGREVRGGAPMPPARALPAPRSVDDDDAGESRGREEMDEEIDSAQEVADDRHEDDMADRGRPSRGNQAMPVRGPERGRGPVRPPRDLSPPQARDAVTDERDEEVAGEEEPESDVVDVDDGPSELGERPAGEFGRGDFGGGGEGFEGGEGGGRRRRRRRRRGRGRGGRDAEGQSQQPFGNDASRGQQPHPPMRSGQPGHQQSRAPYLEPRRAAVPPMHGEDTDDTHLPEPGNAAIGPTSPGQQNGEPQEGGRRRRRRRRGRRGRGRRGGVEGQQAFSPHGQPQPIADEPFNDLREMNVADRPAEFEEADDRDNGESAPIVTQEMEPVEADEPVPPATPEKESKPKRRRKSAPKTSTAAKPAAIRSRRKKPASPRTKKSTGSASQSAPGQAPPPAPMIRTGSTDRHLVSDEPVLPPPTTRPRTYRDLDAIPDDFD